MGASGWDYKVNWQANVQDALDELCRERFAAGDYYRGWEFSAEFLEDTISELESEVFAMTAPQDGPQPWKQFEVVAFR
jgi:hypothetical protein